MSLAPAAALGILPVRYDIDIDIGIDSDISTASSSQSDPRSASPSDAEMGLHNLPYDLLLNVAQYLDLKDVHALQITCKSLQDFTTTRPVYRNLANDLLRRCRALPLRGFQRLSDLTTEQLIQSVNQATHYERAWRVRAPRPVTSLSPLDSFDTDVVHAVTKSKPRTWYKVVRSPPQEDVDWLSPITSSYTLCATKSGKVVCWDVHSDSCLAEWNPGERWELWKCRVEFEERTVFFTMAKILSQSYDDERVMEFVLMKLQFPETSPRYVKGRKPPMPPALPAFVHVMGFKTTGVVMNVFLLDPPQRLLSAFVWVAASNTIGLYALLDWNKQEYVFIDTGIECLLSSNWSCILSEDNIVIHSEESDAAFQHFYPISLLQKFSRKLPEGSAIPVVAGRVAPAFTQSKGFIFPLNVSAVITAGDTNVSTINGTDNTNPPNPNPYPFPQWYPESAHFVRQWWPTLPGLPRLSCTVVLLATHDLSTHRTRFVLAQHYFKVPMASPPWGPRHDYDAMTTTTTTVDNRGDGNDPLMRLWYVSRPFEVVCVVDGSDDDDEVEVNSDRPRPLVAVDFGHAAWIEYVNGDEDRGLDGMEKKWLRFVTFPPVCDESGSVKMDREGGGVQTLDVPEELDLDNVETINIDQSQGAVILSVKEGKIFILCYE